MTTSSMAGARPYHLTIDGFAAHHLYVHSLKGREAISEAWSFEVAVTSDVGDDLEQTALGKRAVLQFDVAEKERSFYGVVAAVKLVQISAVAHRIRYQVRVVPRLWLLKRKQRTRIFQKMSVPEVVTSVLLEAGVAARWQLTRTYPKRQYCTQYEETDYKFIRRLLAEEGIYFYFPQGGPISDVARLGDEPGALLRVAAGSLVGSVASMAETLIPGDTFIGADDAACYPPLRGDDASALAVSTAAAMGAASGVAGTGSADVTEKGAAPALRFLENEDAAVTKRDKVTRFELHNTVRSSAATFRDYDPDKPMVRLQSVAVSTDPFPPSPFEVAASAAAAAENMATPAVAKADTVANETGGTLGQKVPFEVYEHHAPYLFPSWTLERDEALKILRQKRRRASVVSGESSCSDLCPGHRFALDAHPAPQLDREWVVTSVEHHGETHPEGGEWKVYWASFACTPTSMTIVPARPRRRSVQVALTATVVGPRGEDIHVDERGRIKVQFHWDRDGHHDENSSCWIRSMQPWAGAGWGHQFIPRIGTEVVVVFEGGDPDKPMVIGSLYNGTHPPSFKLPEDKTRSGIRTRSSPGGTGFNELSFEDATAREQIYLHAQRNLDEVVGQNHTLLVRNDELIRVLQNRIDRIERNLEVHVSGDQTNRVAGNRIDVVSGSADVRVSGMMVTRVEGKERREVQSAADLVYADDLTTRVLGCQTTIVGKHDKERTWMVHAEGSSQVSGSRGVKLISDEEVVLQVGKSSIRLTKEKIELDAPSVSTTGKGGSMSVADEGLVLRSKDDARLAMGKSMLLKTEGASMWMQKEVKVDGQKILLNSPEQAKDEPPKEPEPPTKIDLKAQDGEPISYQRFVVRMEDGSEVGGKTGEDGKAQIDLGSSGKIIFPDVTMPGDSSSKGDLEPHVVKQGEYLQKLAFVHGFDADLVWNDERNTDLRKLRPDPGVLLPGDVLLIPKKRQEGQPIHKGTENSYTVVVPRVKVELVFRDGDQPLAGASCEVHGLGAAAAEPKKTDGDGKLELDVPVTTREVSVVFPEREGMTFHFYIGDMDPVNEASGVEKRLLNLGYLPVYYAHDPDEKDAWVQKALRSFQADSGIDPTGELDEATQKALLDSHQA